VERPGTDLKVQRLENDAALSCPIILKGQNQALEGRNIALFWGHAGRSLWHAEIKADYSPSRASPDSNASFLQIMQRAA